MSKTDHVGAPFQFRAASGPCCTTTQHGADRLDFAKLCARCKRRAEDAGFSPHTSSAPARAAATPKPRVVMRAAVGADGRTAAERAADRELLSDLRRLGSGRLAEEPTEARPTTATAATLRRPTYEPRGYSRAVGHDISRPAGLADGDPPPVVTPEERAEATEEDREAARVKAIVRRGLPWIDAATLDGMDLPTLRQWAEAIEAREAEFAAAVADAEANKPRGISKAMAARQTAEQKAAAEIDAVSRATELPDGKPWPYARALAREQTLAELRAGRPDRLERPRRQDPTRPPKPYTRALEARKAVAA